MAIAAVLVLVVLQHRDQRAADRDAGAVQRVDEARALAVARAGSGRPCGAPGNRRRPSRTRSRDRRSGRAARPRCRRSCARRSPCRRCTASSCGTAGRAASAPSSAHAVMRSCSASELSCVGDRDQLDLVELVLAQHAARVAAGRTGFRAEARGERGEAQRQPLPQARSPRARGWSAGPSAVGMSPSRPSPCGTKNRSSANFGSWPVPNSASSRTISGGCTSV